MALSSQHKNKISDIQAPNTILGLFKRFYENFDASELDKLGNIYTDDVTFTDPIHTISGLQSLTDYFQAMCGNLSHCHFEFKDEILGDGQVVLKWEMHYQHPSLKSNKRLKLSGVSLIFYAEKVYRHEDYYDMGAMVYEQLPLLGSAIRAIKSRLSQ